jgi:hypothetical protein
MPGGKAGGMFKTPLVGISEFETDMIYILLP